jgi:tRNA nucleotidyltransferase (CCA-adding enzyme)
MVFAHLIQFISDSVTIAVFQIRCKQDSDWHPEGDAWVHSQLVCDALNIILIQNDIFGIRREQLMLAALLHDVGKAITTEYSEDKNGKLRWRSPGHDIAGVPIAANFLNRIGYKNQEKVLKLVRWHMVHTRKDNFADKSVRKLANNLYPASIFELCLLMKADCMGRGTASSDLPDGIISNLIPKAMSLGVFHHEKAQAN